MESKSHMSEPTPKGELQARLREPSRLAELVAYQESGVVSRALVARETLNEQEILEVTGLPPAPRLETAAPAVPDIPSRSVGAA